MSDGAKRIIVFLAGMALALAAGNIVVRFVLPLLRTQTAPPVAPPGMGSAPGSAVAQGLPVWYRFLAMGGVSVEVRVWGRAETAFMYDAEESEKLVEELEREISSWRPESATSAANRAAVGEAVTLPPRVAQVASAAFRLVELSGNAFNPAVGPLIGLWKEAARRGSEPTADEIAAIRDRCAPNAFRLDASALTITKLVEGARLDFGGIATGSIVDQVTELLRQRGVTSGIITAGGDRRVFGGAVSRRVAIQHPETKGRLYGYFHLLEGAAATSGNGERYYEIGSKRYGHIFDPRTLRPADGPLSVTVTAPDCTTADGLATAVYVLGTDEGLALAERLPDVEALVLYREGDRIRQARTAGFPEVRDISDLERPFPED